MEVQISKVKQNVPNDLTLAINSVLNTERNRSKVESSKDLTFFRLIIGAALINNNY
jgi:hypothetical protein